MRFTSVQSRFDSEFMFRSENFITLNTSEFLKVGSIEIQWVQLKNRKFHFINKIAFG